MTTFTTIEQETRDELIDMISDAYKSANGFRPRGIYNYDAMSTEDLQNEVNELVDQANAEYDREQEFANEQVAKFEASVQNVIECGAGNRETALRWMTQTITFYTSMDVEGYVYSLGILFTDFGRKLSNELLEIVELQECV